VKRTELATPLDLARLTKSERARMVQIDALLRAYLQARNRHQVSYPADLVAAQAAAAELALALSALAELGPTSRELLGLARQWEASRSRYAAQVATGSQIGQPEQR